jgi:tRNA pseudouridine38-40 synthase
MKADPPLRNHRLLLAYDGTAYKGLQLQGEIPTVQLHLEKALKICYGRRVIPQPSGRTDTGVHALGLVVSYEAPGKFGPFELLNALNGHLPDDIRVLRAGFAPKGFHARFDATGKEYLYRIINHRVFSPFEIHRAWHVPRPLDLGLLRRAAKLLEGRHDFASFTSDPGYKRATTVRVLHSIRVAKKGPLLAITYTGDGFLYRMARNLTGALVKVGHGRVTLEELEKILAARSRLAAPPTAPACGLYLKKVFYTGKPVDYSVPENAEE